MTCQCNGTHLLPFKREDGTTVPHTYLDCECKQDEPVSYNELRPEDFDFPCSDSFRGYFTERHGYPWEGRDTQLPEDGPEEQPAKQPWDKRQQYQIDQTRAELLHIKRLLAEKTNFKLGDSKKTSAPRKQYNGLKVE